MEIARSCGAVKGVVRSLHAEAAAECSVEDAAGAILSSCFIGRKWISIVPRH
jgi:hypothetical protein